MIPVTGVRGIVVVLLYPQATVVQGALWLHGRHVDNLFLLLLVQRRVLVVVLGLLVTVPRPSSSFVLRVLLVGPHVARKGVLGLCGKVVWWFRVEVGPGELGIVGHHAGPLESHDGPEGEKGRGDEEDHLKDPKDYDGLAEFATARAPVLEIVATRGVLLVPFALARGHVRGDGRPGTQPQHHGQTVDAGEGVDVGEPSSSRPHWYHD